MKFKVTIATIIAIGNDAGNWAARVDGVNVTSTVVGGIKEGF